MQGMQGMQGIQGMQGMQGMPSCSGGFTGISAGRAAPADLRGFPPGGRLRRIYGDFRRTGGSGGFTAIPAGIR